MNRPPYGACVPVTWHRCRDADTIEVLLRTGQVAAIRLAGINAAEAATPKGRAATRHVESLLERTPEPLSAFFELPRDVNGDGFLDVTDLLKALSFDRIPGRLFVGDLDLGELLVAEGLAERTE